MRGFEVRALEIHGPMMWQLQYVERVLDFMREMGMNALVFHQNDLIDQLVYPQGYFSQGIMWERWPTRDAKISNNRYYINTVIKRARQIEIDFFAEVKEIWYPEGILELVPELRNPDGSVCATHPFWWEFMEAKVSELLEVVPEIAGIIVSPASRESLVSISANRCKCERCRNYNPEDWYFKLIESMYRPLSKKGKILVIRDFAYRADQQSLAVKAATRCSEEICIALKNTPHDFYPTFPDNPVIGTVGNHPQWIEFDTWGQFYGLGFFPVSVVEDMKKRMKHCWEKGARGVMFRTDWEVINEASNFNSFTLVNLIGGAILAKNIDEELDEIYRKWTNYGLLSPLKPTSTLQKPVVPSGVEAYKKLRDLLRLSWEIIEKGIYVRGHVFHECCQFPDRVDTAFTMMLDFHQQDDWNFGASKLVEPTDENIEIIFREKEKALTEVRRLRASFNVENLGLPDEFAKEIKTILELFELYIEGFNHCTRTCFLVKKAISTRNKSNVEIARESLVQLSSYRDKLTKELFLDLYPHYVYWLMDVKRIESLISDAEAILKSIESL
ncbi:hypothetical protein E308F_22580 [Moorella sp. E308F]|uniref:hypothetical protein n=1 Tax=Moorella sp. E308F TaxID=2572682 RepID=UPI0010FFB069|nr:hypothetical protein [Moorella sp. E308F]GEA16014.1 hypothetical protein E308F_22580 [Moorella sp. E308F]